VQLLIVAVKNGVGLVCIESPQSPKRRIHSRDQRLSNKSREHEELNACTFHIMNYPSNHSLAGQHEELNACTFHIMNYPSNHSLAGQHEELNACTFHIMNYPSNHSLAGAHPLVATFVAIRPSFVVSHVSPMSVGIIYLIVF
jgi:hypothetical protein